MVESTAAQGQARPFGETVESNQWSHALNTLTRVSAPRGASAMVDTEAGCPGRSEGAMRRAHASDSSWVHHSGVSQQSFGRRAKGVCKVELVVVGHVEGKWTSKASNG